MSWKKDTVDDLHALLTSGETIAVMTLADGVEKALAGEAEGGQRREVSLGID